jgi:hypothetical protein
MFVVQSHLLLILSHVSLLWKAQDQFSVSLDMILLFLFLVFCIFIFGVLYLYLWCTNFRVDYVHLMTCFAEDRNMGLNRNTRIWGYITNIIESLFDKISMSTCFPSFIVSHFLLILSHVSLLWKAQDQFSVSLDMILLFLFLVFCSFIFGVLYLYLWCTNFRGFRG